MLVASATGGLLIARTTPTSAHEGWSEDDVLRIAKEVRNQIVTLPQYGVFDDIQFGIKDKTVILQGSASRPVLKSSEDHLETTTWKLFIEARYFDGMTSQAHTITIPISVDVRW